MTFIYTNENCFLISKKGVIVKKIRLIGARKYIQGSPYFQPLVEKENIVFSEEDVILPLEKFEENKKFREACSKFKYQIFEDTTHLETKFMVSTLAQKASKERDQRESVSKTRTSTSGVVFDIQRFTIHDGPGIRTLIFLKGCPLRCLWCSNPEGQSGSLELGVFAEKCIGINNCLSEEGNPVCISICNSELREEKKVEKKDLKMPSEGVVSALVIKEGKVFSKNNTLCINCLKCVSYCPSGALVSFGRIMEVDEVFEEIQKDVDFYRKSGGGVTLGGGDPLFQPQFSRKILEKCKTFGINTCIETAVYSQWKIIQSLIPFVDLWLCDIKHIDSKKHEEYTGVGNEIILENIKNLALNGASLVIKTPIVPGYTDSIENIQGISKFIQGLGPAVKQYQLLPYFSFMRSKYQALGRDYSLPEKGPPLEKLKELREIGLSFGVPVVIGAYTEF